VVDAVSAPAPDCGRLFGIFGTPKRLLRIKVDRRGHFARRHSGTDGIASVRGRFEGRRSRSGILRVAWHSGSCRAATEFRLFRVARQRVRSGRWRGTHSGGGEFALDVLNAGREASVSLLRPSPLFRCSDGSSYRLADYLRVGELAWVRRDGEFRLRDAADDRLVTMRGRFQSTTAAGSFRIIEAFGDARGVCDTGAMTFQVRAP
jgi:hypothetical protein